MISALILLTLLSQADNEHRAAASNGFNNAAANVKSGKVTPSPSGAKDKTTVPWAQGKPASQANVRCVSINVLAKPDCLTVFGLEPRKKKANPALTRTHEYVRVRVCGETTDGSAVASLPSCVVAILPTEVPATYTPGTTPHLYGEREDVDADSPCACRRRTDVAGSCEGNFPTTRGGPDNWIPAPFGLTLSSGRWRGDCVRKTCVELLGYSSIDADHACH